MSIFKKCLHWTKSFWQSKTIFFVILRIVILGVFSLLMVNFGTITRESMS